MLKAVRQLHNGFRVEHSTKGFVRKRVNGVMECYEVSIPILEEILKCDSLAIGEKKTFGSEPVEVEYERTASNSLVRTTYVQGVYTSHSCHRICQSEYDYMLVMQAPVCRQLGDVFVCFINDDTIAIHRPASPFKIEIPADVLRVVMSTKGIIRSDGASNLENLSTSEYIKVMESDNLCAYGYQNIADAWCYVDRKRSHLVVEIYNTQEKNNRESLHIAAQDAQAWREFLGIQ